MGAMGINGLLNTRNAAAVDAQLRRQLQHQHPMHMDAPPGYGLDHQATMAHHHHHHHHQHPMAHQNHMGFPTMGTHPHPQMIPANYMPPSSSLNTLTQMNTEQLKPKNEPAAKSFSCSTCSKGFARRSDLARHERIHSGIRPHACEYPGCGKQFIQRSALTVHGRVHTGEKPHTCEICSKPFSDSSSLARHRRIHSGKRPYQCPYANCQKTFTRRTTLTRHQNNHAGTMEQAEAETNARLAMSQSQSQSRSNNSSYSDAASRNSTVSPTRPLSISPHSEVPNMPNLQKSTSEFSYMSQGPMVPQHLRGDFHPGAARVSQAMSATPIASFTTGTQPVPQMTSHPSAFRPAQTLEPPASSGNEGVSPHMSGMGWPAENNNSGMPHSTGMDAYPYQDPSSYGTQGMYYQGSNLRRPQSTEPEDGYRMQSRYINHHLNGSNMSMAPPEWNQMPMNMHEVKQERGYAG